MDIEILELLKKVAYDAGELLKGHDVCDYMIEEKTSNKDLMTQYDKSVQEYIINTLSESITGASFLAEEMNVSGDLNDEQLFIIDPIDGTTNFVHGIPYCAISIAYYRTGRPIAGVVYNPYLKEMYYGEKGQGAFCNAQRIQTADNKLKHALVIFGTSPYNNETTENTFSRIQYLYGRCQDIRRFGSASLDICQVAAGVADLYFEARLSAWDYAAARIILEEAGGVLVDYAGKTVKLGRQKTSIIAGTEQLIKESNLVNFQINNGNGENLMSGDQ